MPAAFESARALAGVSVRGLMTMAAYVDATVSNLAAQVPGSTMLNAAYFAPVTFKAFFNKPPAGEGYIGIREAPLSMLIPILIACFISVLIGIFPQFMMTFVKVVTG